MTETGLNGSVIWVTRPRDQAGALCNMIDAAGGVPVRFPVVAIRPLKVNTGKSDLIQDRSTIFIFVSTNAVIQAKYAAPELMQHILHHQVLGMGTATCNELEKHGFTDFQCATEGVGSEALLQLGLLRPENLDGRNIVIIRGEGGRDRIKQELEAHGVPVEYLEVYQRSMPETDARDIESTWRHTPPDVIVITSVEGLQNLINMTAEHRQAELFGTALVVMSNRIAEAAASRGFNNRVNIAPESSDAGLMQAITNMYGE